MGVVVVGGSDVGEAVDSFNLNAPVPILRKRAFLCWGRFSTNCLKLVTTPWKLPMAEDRGIPQDQDQAVILPSPSKRIKLETQHTSRPMLFKRREDIEREAVDAGAAPSA